MENNNPYTDTTTRKYQNSNYEKTKDGWVKRVEQTEQAAAAQASPADTKKEYSDEELANFARKASDEALRKAGSGRDERMRVAAKKEILRRKNEGMPEPEKSDNPFDEGLEKGWFDNLPTKKFGNKEYINKGQGWEPLEKGRASVGEIRIWSGEKYQKTATGWKYLGKADGSAPKAKEEPKPYDKPWPESLDKLTNRASWDEIHTEAEAVAQVRFDEQYPNPEEDFFKELIEDDKKYPWRTPHYEDLDNQGKEQWKANRKAEWISRDASYIMQPSRRGPAPSKTTMISNVKSAWKAIQDKKDRAKADADYKALLESDEGKARKEAFGKALKENVEAFVAIKDSVKENLRNTFNDQLVTTGILSHADFQKMKFRFSQGLSEQLRISGLSDRWEDTNIYYGREWGDKERVYKVDTTSFGRVEPNSKESSVLMLQVQCLSNPAIIDAVKNAIERVNAASHQMREQNKELANEYSEIKSSDVWDEFVPDDIDLE